MRTAPLSTEAVTECPRLRPSKISFNTCLGLSGLSGMRGDGGGAGRLASCFTCGAAASCTRWEGTARGFLPRRKKNEPAPTTAISTIAATAESASRRFLVGREAEGSGLVSVAGVAAPARVGIITVGSPSSGCGVTLIGRAPVTSNLRGYSLRCVGCPRCVGWHVREQAAEGREAFGAVERAKHRPDRRLVRGHYRFLELPLPGRDRRHRREIAPGHHEDLDLRPIDPGKGIARVLRAELPDRIRVGRAKSLERDSVVPVLRLEIAGGTLVD